MKLSICIPAYGRQAQINELLDSIAYAAKRSVALWQEVEVVVSDNASSPPLVLSSFESVSGARLKLIRQSCNIGAAKNFIAVAMAATGDYCWWMGSDDVVIEDALVNIYRLVVTNKKSKLWVFDRYDWQPKTSVFYRRSWYKDLKYASSFDLNKDTDMVALASASVGCGGIFSYLGSLVFDKSFFSLAGIPDSVYNTAYPHAFVLLRARPPLVCNLEPLVKCRLGDDSFSSKSALSRLLIDIDGYAVVLDNLNLSLNVRFQFDQVVVRELVYNYLKSTTNTFGLFMRSSPFDIARMRKWVHLQLNLPLRLKFIAFTPVIVLKIASGVRLFAKNFLQRSKLIRFSNLNT